eukprot:FR744418.1.p1 GENE.FR744418.1~~FR744418.1.p1  ORF type:complete len:298 (+),score=36.49 FR744418.1:82-894(+)
MIVDGSRWGIALRSETEGNSTSNRNLVKHNHIRRMGQQTKDFGGLSFIGYEGVPDADTVVQYNCVTDNIGVFSKVAEGVMSPYMNYGIYMDNEASGYYLYGNVLKHSVTANLFYREGRHIVAENNILANARDTGGGGQIAFKAKSGWTENISFVSNIVYWHDMGDHNLELIYDSSGVSDFMPESNYFTKVDHNTYWVQGGNKTADFLRNNELSPLGNWLNWTAAGYDANSEITDPLFMNPHIDDYRFGSKLPCFSNGIPRAPALRNEIVN